MKNRTLFFGVVVLTFALGVATTTKAEPCGDYTPGQTQTPPCAYAQRSTDESTDLGQTQIPLDSSTFDLTSAVEEALIQFLLF